MRRSIVGVVGIATIVCVAGCGASGQHRSHQIAKRPDPVRPPVRVSGQAQRTTSLRAVKQAEIAAPNASWLSYYDGSVWVKRDDGYVMRVDPQTDRATGRVGSYTDQDHYCQGISAGGGAVWSCQKGFITRIDPRTMRIVARVPIGKAFDEGRYVYLGGRIWIITGPQANQLTGIDTATNRPGQPIRLPYSCSDLAPGGDAVWVLCPTSGHVVKVDVAHGRAAGSVTLPATYNGYATPSDLWVGSDADLVRLDARTLRPKAIFRGIGPGMGGDVTVDGDHVWVSTNAGPLYLIDGRTNSVVERIRTPSGLGGGALIAAAGSLWNTPGSAGPVVRLRADRRF
jgi:hypothetical protein